MTRQLVATIAALASLHAAQPDPPANLSALIVKAGVDGTPVSWCNGEFRARGRQAYAAALMSATGGGRYVVLEAGATVAELGLFKDGAELSCYTPSAARKINDTIRRSETISGRVAPMFDTTVVCGFVENTTAVCWQYSPKARTFVNIGGWQT